MTWTRKVLIWSGLLAVILGSIGLAAASPLLAWRDPYYIVAGFSGIVGMALLLVQPLLARGYLPGLSGLKGRAAHGKIGAALVIAVVVHVGGLWITSPPDVVDALLLRSPTPFSIWGVIAMWTVFATGLLAMLRSRLKMRLRTWQKAHLTLAAIIVVSSVVHALLIEGTMETFSKVILCALAIGMTVKVGLELKILGASKARR